MKFFFTLDMNRTEEEFVVAVVVIVDVVIVVVVVAVVVDIEQKSDARNIDERRDEAEEMTLHEVCVLLLRLLMSFLSRRSYHFESFRFPLTENEYECCGRHFHV
jgi:hypothetical protein